MGYRLKWVALALLAFVAGQADRAEGVLPKVRIGLLEGREVVSFGGPAGVTIESLDGERVIGWAPPSEAWEARAGAGEVRVLDAAGGEKGAAEEGLKLLPPEDGVVTIGGVEGHWDGITERQYRGIIEIRAGRRLTVVNVIDVESYLRGVVPSEMPANYPLGALQAQAVAARGQALIKAGRHAREGFDLCATQHCQVYGGATSEAARTDQAVASTWGEVLVYEGRLADTLYSSTCGGHTANNEDYWPSQSPVPYLRGQEDFEPEDDVRYAFPLAEDELRTYLKYAPRANCNQPRYGQTDRIRWWMVTPREELEATLKERVGDFGELLDVRVAERAESGLVKRLAVIGTRRLYRVEGGGEIRWALGGLRSASFAIEAIGGNEEAPVAFVIWGAGWGHQVGMCQVGAAGLAEKGWGYRKILTKYYPGCAVQQRY